MTYAVPLGCPISDIMSFPVRPFISSPDVTPVPIPRVSQRGRTVHRRGQAFCGLASVSSLTPVCSLKINSGISGRSDA
jgi:hypothetical protein